MADLIVMTEVMKKIARHVSLLSRITFHKSHSNMQIQVAQKNSNVMMVPVFQETDIVIVELTVEMLQTKKIAVSKKI